MKFLSTLALLTITSTSFLRADESFHETLHSSWGQTFDVNKVVYHEQSDLQDLVIFDNDMWGRVLALDGIIQLTTSDEFIYHEMLTHVPMLAHGNAKKVLIIGGGDGGTLREVLRHTTVEEVDLIEIDEHVINLSREYLPSLSNGAFEDPRANIIITDGAKYVKETEDKYDVIICDTTDPIGPGQVLFTEEFYTNCKRCLKPNGIMANQDSVPLIDHSYLAKTTNKRKNHYKYATFYQAAVPTYVGGVMALGFSSDADYSNLTEDELQKRMKKNVSGKMKYYTPSLHLSSFSWPAFLLDTLQE